MKKEMDKIQFEYRYEVQELMKVIDKYVKQNPAEKENKTLERFFDLLDVMDMEWYGHEQDKTKAVIIPSK